MGANRLIRPGAARPAIQAHRASAAGAPEGPICRAFGRDYYAPWLGAKSAVMLDAS